MNRKHDNLHNCGKMLKISPAIPRRETGFSLIEILLVLTIVGIIVAVVVPRAHRAQVSAKYSIVRQSAAELGTWGVEWAERNLNSQQAEDTCSTYHYLDTLLGYTGSNATDWISVTATLAGGCRNPGALPNPIQFSVANIMPQEKLPKNPFNGASYFSTLNGGGTSWTAGDLYLGSSPSTRTPGVDEVSYYFIYHGTDSTLENTWHAGMGNATPPASPAEANLRNGVFVTRQRVP